MRLSAPRHSARLSLEMLDLACSPASLLEALAAERDPVMLDSSALSEQFGRYSVLTCEPMELLALDRGLLTDAGGNVLARTDEGIWQCLESAFGCVEVAASPADLAKPYGPGWFGYLGYELGRCVERLPGRAARDTAFPDVRLGFHDATMVYDAVERRWWLAEVLFDDPPAGAGLAGAALRRIASSAAGRGCDGFPCQVGQAHAGAMETINASANFAPEQYRQAVARCTDYIAAGDIFQVNLSQRFEVPDAPDPLAIYASLRGRNPACYAAFMSFRWRGRRCAVASCSPELFLRLAGRDVLTRPIKGTRPRVGDPAADQAAAAELLASPKDNAELAMIVDLLRNDLGRVCRFGSVRVVEPRRLETHPTVFHLVATIEGSLRPGVGPAALIRATFPGGSITGAPKIRAMEIIDELEPAARGVYTGCIGHVGVNGRAEWNIAIRTIVWQAGTAYVQVGGGIVADSTPQGEYDETLAKARAMLEAVAEVRRARRPVFDPEAQTRRERRGGEAQPPQPASRPGDQA